MTGPGTDGTGGPARGRVVVVGIGNPFRRDDGAGPAVVEALRGRVPDGTVLAVSDGEPGRLLDLWAAGDTVVVVDTVRARPADPGRLHRLPLHGTADAHAAPAPASTHRLGLGETVALAGVLGRLPRRLVVHAVEGDDFGYGTGTGPAVTAALSPLAERVLHEVRRAWRQARADG